MAHGAQPVRAASGLADREPAEFATVREACNFLGISTATLYRLPDLRRTRLSPGRVGIRVGDILEHHRRAGSDFGPFVDSGNAVVYFGGDPLTAEWLLGLPVRVNTILRRSAPQQGAEALHAVRLAQTPAPFSIELPAAWEALRCGRRELVLIDFDGLNGREPTVLVPQEGEHIGPRAVGKRVTVTEQYAMTRLVPICGSRSEVPGGWWIG